MHTEFLMGNEAIALGALAAGVNVVCGYPGTPSSEVLETVAARRTAATYVEWSVNEKAALEMAAGVAYSGGRALATMKQVGLNVASDPLMSLEYVGVKGGLVILSADDPGPISSQTEQDTRTFAAFSKVPCFDPSSAAEAYRMIGEAFELSEKYGTPVFLRPTTRVCHGYASIEVKDENEYYVNTPSGFEKDSSRWVIFPRLSFANHTKIEARNEKLREEFSDNPLNEILSIGVDTTTTARPASQEQAAATVSSDSETQAHLPRIGFAAGGISFVYAAEELSSIGEEYRTDFPLLKVATPFPFPEKLALSFLEGLDAVLVFEELDPVIERELTYICGKYGLKTRICGKLSHHTAPSGENTRDSVNAAVKAFIKEFRSDSSLPETADTVKADSTSATTCSQLSDSDSSCYTACNNLSAPAEPPKLPIRPPVLCAGCPHRASFYAVKKAMEGKKAFFGGDIGCYTLGNAAPLDMVDTCL
ncbi:MAG: hypothetical protein J6Y89_11520, partial [Lachnospiraceae bacterium]|nr:hypothetical protein [Lachnospiraceae bacterium]